METETWEHWACLLLIEYAWLGLPGAVSDERRMKMLMFVELSWILKDPFNLRPQQQPIGGSRNGFRGRIHYVPHLIGSATKQSPIITRSCRFSSNFLKVHLGLAWRCNKLLS